MELKKSKKSDLENKKQLFFFIGLVIALGVMLVGFEWKSKSQKVDSLGDVVKKEVEEEIIPVTRDPQNTPPPPPPPKVIENLNIVNDDIKIDDNLDINTEADNQTMIDVAPAAVTTTKVEEETEEAQVFFIVEDMPEFPGGDAALKKFLVEAVKYPVIAQENGIQGKVYVTFVVDKDGSVTNAVIARGVDPSLDKEALRVVNSQPKWKPGKQRGKPVKVSFTVPISFVLQ